MSRPADIVTLEDDVSSTVPPVLRVSGLGKRYAETGPAVLSNVSFDVGVGELLAIVGPSGCGKTTLLRLICGLTRPTDGTVLLDGRPVVRPPREMALVFQDYSRSLFPWLTVVRNVMFPLRRLGLSKRGKIERAEAVLREMGLEGTADKYPWELSGGMQQRVAIARALVSHPEVILLDEPFASVDALTRAELQDVLLRVHGSRDGERGHDRARNPRHRRGRLPRGPRPRLRHGTGARRRVRPGRSRPPARAVVNAKLGAVPHRPQRDPSRHCNSPHIACSIARHFGERDGE